MFAFYNTVYAVMAEIFEIILGLFNTALMNSDKESNVIWNNKPCKYSVKIKNYCPAFLTPFMWFYLFAP